MANISVLFVLALVCVSVNAENQATNKKPLVGQTFDEIVVMSDLKIRRKSKENRYQEKKLLTNVPSGTTGPSEKSTAFASKLVYNDGSNVTPVKRERREAMSILTRLAKQRMAEYVGRKR